MLPSDETLLAEKGGDLSETGSAELMVSQLYVLPETVHSTDPVSLGVDVRNDGTAESGAFQVRMTLDNAEPYEFQYPNLRPGESHWEEWQHAPLSAGSHILAVDLDPNNQVQEGNKYDNSASLPFQVAGEAIADIGTNLSKSDVEAALDLGTPELTSSDSTLELAGAPSLFASTIPAPLVTRAGTSILVTIYFGHDDFLMDAENAAAVEALAGELRFMVKPDVKVDGYASGEGNAAENVKLSQMRRETVIAHLNKEAKDLQYDGTAHGGSDFAVEETAKAGAELEAQRAQNRRVTIFVMGSAEIKPEKKKPITITPPPPPEETDEERLNRILKDRSHPNTDHSKDSFTDKFWEKVDETVDSVTRKITNNKKIRDTIKEGVHKAIEKGSEEILDQALDQTSLGKSEKDAIKSGIKAGIQYKF